MDSFSELQDLPDRKAILSERREKLTEALLSAGSMQDIADTAWELLGNPLTIVDAGHRYIAATDIELEDSYWNDAFKRKYVSGDIVLMLSRSKEIREIFRSRTPVMFKTHVATREILANVFVEQKVVARISVHELSREFREEDLDTVAYLSRIVALEIQKSKYNYINNDQAVKCFFGDLLDDRISDEVEIKERIKYLELPLQQYNYVFAVDTGLQEHDLPMQNEIMEQISLILHNSISITYKSGIVTFISLDSIDNPSEEALKELESYLRSKGLAGGLSACFNDIGDFKKHYLQSVTALRLRSHINSKKVINRYEDYYFHHIADICSKEVDLASLCHPAVFILLENDRRNSGGLLKTLFFYLKSDRSIAETAKALHIHRNTLDYRISKMKSIIHVDWNNSDIIKHIYMSLRMLEYMEHNSFENSNCC